MPSRNVSKNSIKDSYYHLYTRGISKQNIFQDELDYRFFLSLFERYLSNEIDSGISKNLQHKLDDAIEVLAYCLMPNHFHLLVYQIKENGINMLMHEITTSYGRYFNSKYNRKEPLFESHYKASHIVSNNYLLRISRYIHRNPVGWIDYPYSSIKAYLYDDTSCWMNKKRIAGLYGSAVKYYNFLFDYKAKIDSSNN